MKLTIVDLFAGAGGLSEGFKQVGFGITAAVEWDKKIAETYGYNHPETKLMIEDVANISKKDLGKCNVILGGPPCQGFSVQGKRFIDDPRNRLYKEFIRLVSEVKPPCVIMENVPGLISTFKGLFVKQIFEDFKEIGYDIKANVLNARYYGVPQNRNRIFFLATTPGLKINFPRPKSSALVTAGDAIKDLEHRQFDESTNHVWEGYPRIIAKAGGIPEDHDGKAMFKSQKFRSNYRRLRKNLPSLTVTATGESTLMHYSLCRWITIREAARLQSFPDTYIFKGTMETMRRCIGNAVPPLLTKAIATEVKEGFKKWKK